MAHDDDEKQARTNPQQLGEDHDDDGDLTLRQAYARFERGLPACFHPAGSADRICVFIIPETLEDEEEDDGTEQG